MFFRSLGTMDLIALIVVFTLMICEKKNCEELDTLGNLIIAIGGLILAISSHKKNNEVGVEASILIQRKLDHLDEQIRHLVEKKP
ncbi:hypothetical protein P22_0686 [Propionispora sp. 2/2-37]|uniref:hypothetical protein n=1 Tax=Propionispora sp. 2/2-37 TaxID=1677858 RepID=UPI0006BB89A6|nr:hypothetical protein [Propionispora sp. 2/2-37]CUH94620.1 hypothetical protein P22_0686 [Propionispora sp. 2/2-37]